MQNNNQLIRLIDRIKKNGITPKLSIEYKLNLEIANVFNILFIFLVIPFVITFRETPFASLITCLPIVAHLLSFLLIRFHRYKLGRIIFSVTTPTTVYFVAAYLYTDSGTDGMAAKLLLLGTIMMPFIVFRTKEWRITLLILLLNLFYLVTFNYTNGILNAQNVHNVDTAGLRLITILTEFIMFSSIFFYYKKVITESYKKLDETNKELVNKNNKLTELNTTKNKFFSILSHDLRGPLHSMLGCAEMLHRNNHHFNEVEVKEFAEAFYKTSENTYRIVENLLSWSQSQMNSINLNKQSYNLKGFVNETIVENMDIAHRKNIQILNNVEDHITVEADKNIAKLVLQNLLSNAIKFSYDNNSINITASVKKKNELAAIYVIDNGTGMDYETVSNLFKIENKRSRPGTNNEPGTGMGLILCKEFAELNGGSIFAQSRLGEGSKFWFTLPLSNVQIDESEAFNEEITDSVLN